MVGQCVRRLQVGMEGPAEVIEEKKGPWYSLIRANQTLKLPLVTVNSSTVA